MKRILLHWRGGKFVPINPQNIPEYERQMRERRIRKAGEKLASIDWAMFRPARWTAKELGQMARIPDTFIQGYIVRYARAKRGLA